MPRTTTRNQRRQTDFFDVEAEEGTATPRSTRRHAPGTEATAAITASDLTAMMASLQQSQADNFERILTRVLETRPPSFSPAQAPAALGTATPTPTSSALPAPGNFATCKARYSGATEESLDGFIDAVEAFKDCANVSDANALRGLSMLLTHDAATWWQGVKATATTWSDALQNLRSAFGDSRPPHGIYIELFSKPQTLHEKTELFVAKARAQLAHLPSGDLSEKVQLDMIYGLLNQKVRKRLRRDEFSNFNQLLQKARCIEEACAPSSAAAAPSKGAAGAATRKRGAKSPGAADNGAGAPSWSSTHNTPLPVGSKPSSSTEKHRYCVYCKKHGHTRDQCDKLKKSDSRNSDKNVNTNSVACYGCGESGVIRSNCTKCNSHFSAIDFLQTQDGKPITQVSTFPSLSAGVGTDQTSISCNKIANTFPIQSVSNDHNYTSPGSRHNNSLFTSRRNSRVESYNRTQVPSEFESVPPGKPTKQCVVNNITPNNYSYSLCCKIDRNNCVNNDRYCAASQCLSRSRVTMNFPGQRPEICDSSRATTIFSGQRPGIPGSEFRKSEFKKFACSSIGHEHSGVPRRPILGIEVLGIRGRGLIDTAAKGTIAGSSLYALLRERNQDFKSSSMRVKLADGSAPTRQMLSTTLEVKIQGKCINVDFLVFPEATDCDTLLGIDFLTAAGLDINFATSTWHFHGSTEVYPLEYEYPSNLASCSAAELLREDEGTMLTPPEREALASLLERNEDVFGPGGEPTPYAEHHIDTGDHAPISVPPYRLTPAKKQLMKTELDNMLRDGIIEECESAWTSPAVLVPKKDNSIRFCVDYRKLNAITKTDSYPLPLIDELLQLTKRHCFMSSIDLRAGYWQVQVRPADRDKTAFVTPFGTYRFTRMPFGLKNAPSTFQRLIDRFRSGASLQGVVLIAYLDDLLVISEDYHSHLEDLQKVFDRLRLFSLRANRVKCFFVRPEINYLGHIITPEGIKPDSSKIDAVLQMASPKDLKHLKSFLQTCSWFRKFVPNFSQIAQPLTILTRKNEPWRWDSQQQEAFQCLKNKLTSAPILVQADYSQSFVLRTDASNIALGAVLLQGEGHEEKPIEYASRLLTSAEKNYSTTEREALAVVWATEKFRGYLDGHTVVIKSDHQPLKWLLTLKTPNGRLIRWAMKLQAFDIRFEYTPGKANVVADALSRPQCDDTNIKSCDVCSVVVDLPRVSSVEIRKEQLDDPEVAKIINNLEDTGLVDTQWLERGYVMNQGVLYRYIPDSDSEQPQLVVPLTMRDKILKEFHDAPTAGHQGVERTYNRISQNYYFVGMRKYISDYLKNCEECQRYKASNQKPAGLLQTPVLNQRGEVLAIDLFGPLPEGEHGEKWILLVEDTATRWVELFALTEATAEICASVLINEYFLRYGFPRRIISDNGVQFISATMQQCMYILGIKQNLIPLYHPEANPAERKNRDLRTQLSILVKNEHRMWPKFLSSVRFSMNSATCSTTGASPAQVMFAREMRSPFDAQCDLRGILDKENFLPQVTPYLRQFLDNWNAIRDRAERHQDDRKDVADKNRQTTYFQTGDLVFLTTHLLSDASKGRSRKFMPKRDGPYRISKIVSPTTYEVTDLNSKLLGKFHVSDLKPYYSRSGQPSAPVQPRRLRGRPRQSVRAEPPSGRCSDSEGEDITGPCNGTNTRQFPRTASRSGLANESAMEHSRTLPAPRPSRDRRLPARFR